MKMNKEEVKSIMKDAEMKDAECINVKEALIKRDTFRSELKRHGISVRSFMKYGHVINHYNYDGNIHVIMGKYKNVHDYNICTINGLDGLVSNLPPTDREKLAAAAEEWRGEEHTVEVCRKYFYVCKNNGAFHRGDAAHLPGYASYLGKFDCDGVRVLWS